MLDLVVVTFNDRERAAADPELASRFATLGGMAHTLSLTADQAAKVDARLPV